MPTFDQAFEKLFGHEGGYANDPRDPGGETKFGISKRSYPHLDIKNLTLEDAKEIYLRDFWGPAGCDALPEDLRDDVFDVAVNSGPRQAIKLLQRAAGAGVDGVLGPGTLMAVGAMPTSRIIARFHGWRLDMMNDLPQWPTYSRGWVQRVADYLKEA